VRYLHSVHGFTSGSEITNFGLHWSSFLSSSTCPGGACGHYALDVLGSVSPSGTLHSVIGSRFIAFDKSPFETGGLWDVYNELDGLAKGTGLDAMVANRNYVAAETDQLIEGYMWRR